MRETVVPNPHIGSDFDAFLEEEGILNEVDARAIKRVLAWQIAQCMNEQHMTKAELARRLATSRTALDRLLDPANPSVTLQTLQRVASALGKRLRVELV